MRVLYVYSRADIAGVGIAGKLIKKVGNELVRGFDEDVVQFEFLEELEGFDAFLVLSRHRSETGIPTLTVHSTGNLTKQAMLGGRGEELSMSFPRLNGFLLRKLREYGKEAGVLDEVRVSYEATHHGPTGLKRPISFIEIGSDESMWRREDLQELVAETVAEAHSLIIKDELPECERAVGFGGGHYSERYTGLTFERGVCFGHIVPKYAIREGLSLSVLSQVFEKNFEGVFSAYLEKKAGNKDFRDLVERFAADRGVKIEYF